MTATLALLVRYRAAIGLAIQIAVLAGLVALAYHFGVNTTTTRYELVLAQNEVAAAKAIATFHRNADTVAAASAKRLSDSLALERKTNDAIRADLTAKLDASQLRTVRLGGDVRRLLDSAATGSSVAAAGPPFAPSGTPGAAEDDDPTSCADLAESAADNYGISRRNSARLTELQRWYRDLRETMTPTVDR